MLLPAAGGDFGRVSSLMEAYVEMFVVVVAVAAFVVDIEALPSAVEHVQVFAELEVPWQPQILSAVDDCYLKMIREELHGFWSRPSSCRQGREVEEAKNRSERLTLMQ